MTELSSYISEMEKIFPSRKYLPVILYETVHKGRNEFFFTHWEQILFAFIVSPILMRFGYKGIKCHGSDVVCLRMDFI